MSKLLNILHNSAKILTAVSAAQAGAMAMFGADSKISLIIAAVCGAISTIIHALIPSGPSSTTTTTTPTATTTPSK